MVDERTAELLVERLIRRIEQANTYFLMKMGASIKQLRNLTPSQAQQLVQILKYGGNYEKIVKEISKYTGLNIKDIDDIFSTYAKKDQLFYKKFYEYRNKPFIPFDENPALKTQTMALSNIAKTEMFNFTRSNVLGYTIRDLKGRIQFLGLRETYNRVLDEALLNVGQGKETFDSAMTRIMKELGGSGLKTITYDSTYIDKNGIERYRTRRLDSAVQMHLKARLRELHNENQKIFGEEFGYDGVEISVHANPAPDHELAQGRQFTVSEYDENGNLIKEGEFEKLQAGKQATTYDGLVVNLDHDHKNGYRPISELNCYHYIFSIVLGVSKPQYNNEKLQEIIDDNKKGFEYEGKHYTMYEGEQLQRKLERKIREQKDIQIFAKAGGNDELILESQSKITQLTNKYKELSAISDLPTKMERMKVSGYRRTKVNLPKEKTIQKTIKDGAIHFGDLGKARDTNFFAINSSRRSTGHFGNGTYFVSKEEANRLENSAHFSRDERPKKEVDFSDYELYKPSIETEGMRLHNGLKAVNYGEYDDFDFMLMKDDLVRHGISEDKIKNTINIIEEKRKEFENKDYDFQLKQDSLSTIFMKELGYNGIDVRGLENLDNTGYGSVIYNLKKKKK